MKHTVKRHVLQGPHGKIRENPCNLRLLIMQNKPIFNSFLTIINN